MPAAVEASSVNAPLGPSVERCTSNPLSLDELSRQLTSIRVSDTATAFAFDGAFTAGPVAPAASVRKTGSTGWLRSQPTTHSSKSELPTQTRGTASIRPSRGTSAGHTLSTTALVHEAYLKLVNIHQVEWRDRAHFFAMAARLMRRILIDYARGKRREKRGGDAVQVQLTDAFDVPGPVAADDLVALDEALARLEAQSERQCRVVECRCFAGLSLEETAQTLGISVATVKRDWDFSRAWLNRELGNS